MSKLNSMLNKFCRHRCASQTRTHAEASQQVHHTCLAQFSGWHEGRKHVRRNGGLGFKAEKRGGAHPKRVLALRLALLK